MQRRIRYSSKRKKVVVMYPVGVSIFHILVSIVTDMSDCCNADIDTYDTEVVHCFILISGNI